MENLSATFFDLLCTVEEIRVPAVFPPNADIVGMVVSGSTVCVVVAVFTVFIIVAVFVTLVAHLTFTTIHAVGEGALDFVRVVQQVLPGPCVAHHVGPVAPRAVPVLPKNKTVKKTRRNLVRFPDQLVEVSWGT